MDKNLAKAYEEQIRINDEQQKEQMKRLAIKKYGDKLAILRTVPLDKPQTCGKIKAETETSPK